MTAATHHTEHDHRNEPGRNLNSYTRDDAVTPRIDAIRARLLKDPSSDGPQPLVIDLVSGRTIDAGTLRQTLHDVVATIQSHVLATEANSNVAAVLVILDADAAMGDSEHAGTETFWEAALAGAALSMTRTLAIELAKPGHSVNALLVDPRPSRETATLDAVAAQASVLLTQPTPVITGQQIFAAEGHDTGRLRP